MGYQRRRRQTAPIICAFRALPTTTPRLLEIAPNSIAPVAIVGVLSVIAIGETVLVVFINAIANLLEEHIAGRLG